MNRGAKRRKKIIDRRKKYLQRLDADPVFSGDAFPLAVVIEPADDSAYALAIFAQVGESLRWWSSPTGLSRKLATPDEAIRLLGEFVGPLLNIRQLENGDVEVPTQMPCIVRVHSHFHALPFSDEMADVLAVLKAFLGPAWEEVSDW